MKILRPEVSESLLFKGGFENLIDIAVKEFYNITDDELDQICELASEEEMQLFSEVTAKTEKLCFREIRSALQIRNKYVEFYQK
jgi:hypothetical protein